MDIETARLRVLRAEQRATSAEQQAQLLQEQVERVLQENEILLDSIHEKEAHLEEFQLPSVEKVSISTSCLISVRVCRWRCISLAQNSGVCSSTSAALNCFVRL